jgi:AraC family transcriptional regulator
LDLALKYGYETPESFAKAFRRVHGISPSEARHPGMKLKAFPRLSFQISLKGDQEMDYQMIDKAAFRVVGKSIRVSTEDGENLRRIPQFWDECHQDRTCKQLCRLAGKDEMFGICADFDREMKEMTYMIAVTAPDSETEGMSERVIPAATWAVFQSVGPMPDAIQKVWQRIFSEWFPATGYEHADAPELEVYPPMVGKPEDYRCEVWIPIIKK